MINQINCVTMVIVCGFVRRTLAMFNFVRVVMVWHDFNRQEPGGIIFFREGGDVQDTVYKLGYNSVLYYIIILQFDSLT